MLSSNNGGFGSSLALRLRRWQAPWNGATLRVVSIFGWIIGNTRPSAPTQPSRTWSQKTMLFNSHFPLRIRLVTPSFTLTLTLVSSIGCGFLQGWIMRWSTKDLRQNENKAFVLVLFPLTIVHWSWDEVMSLLEFYWNQPFCWSL